MTIPAGSYEPDIAALIDTEEEIVADRYGVGLGMARMIIADRDNATRHNQAEVLSAIIGHLIAGNNMPAKVYSLAIAFGLDQLNGFHSQSEIARQLGCTRALISHYVLGWRDVLAGGPGAFDCMKFRKHNETRETYKAKATNPVVQAKMKAKRKPKT
jgi:hypothetical protein